ncbi:hypothetical protein ACQPX6_10215 [Actinomycetospora sp. CA-101289]|uniref:hypothetical protein n=1 Tax=Actinomycetospora sp. CA-101289 TaxID=3239893 RepID=UPI003D95F7C7
MTAAVLWTVAGGLAFLAVPCARRWTPAVVLLAIAGALFLVLAVIHGLADA